MGSKKIRIDLPEGNQVVTTVKHEKIPSPPKPKGPNVVWFILAVYLCLIFLGAIQGRFGGDPLPVDPSPYPPPRPYPCPDYGGNCP